MVSELENSFILSICVWGILWIVLSAGSAVAAVSGECSNCHTMHNSQDNASMKLDSTPVVGSVSAECVQCHATLRFVMLRMDCLGCHAQSINGASNIISGSPQIIHNAGTDLAAGNFRNVFFDDANGHNVHGFDSALIAQDSNLFNVPPGYDSNFDPSTGGYQPGYVTGQVMCAGQNGCHGNRDVVSQIDAMKGAHHSDDTLLHYGGSYTETGQGSTVGTSYRYLYKVKGAEDSDWENTSGGTDHNEYRGLDYAGRASQTWSDIETMSQFCAECHGNFHSTSGLGGDPWIRHPSDLSLPNQAPYSDYTVYDSTVPVARISISDGSTQASNTVTPGTDTVFCLSCHRAHASPYPDMMRWDYIANCDSGVANVNCGCFTCHTDKDD